ncbi:nitroreductase/quinone reductase family protein [Nocardia sp. CA-151230]|uniref:nitroreductase/quinone reductase family protein n=1 Tax=Nocardia sp. CA-151230 TaxID=3239982 RepID=UPI003D930FFF
MDDNLFHHVTAFSRERSLSWSEQVRRTGALSGILLGSGRSTKEEEHDVIGEPARRPAARIVNSRAFSQLARLFSLAHIRVFRATGGRVGGVAPWRNADGRIHYCLLTTRGRRSGLRRVTPLAYVPTADAVLLVAANVGRTRMPQWYLNIRAAPAVIVETRGHSARWMYARLLTGEEYTAHWHRAVGTARLFARYQTWTSRPIPLVLCSPLPC